jgi:chemotaxis protein MotB
MEEESEPTPEEGAPAWMTSFSDMMVLMLCFFVLLLSFAKMDQPTFHSALGSVRQALGGKGKLPEQREPPPELKEDAPPAPLPPTTTPESREERENKREQATLARIRRFLTDRGLAADVEVSASRRGIILRTKDQVLFDSGGASLKLEGTPILDAVAELARQFPGQLAIEGHSDDRPIQNVIYPSNWELSGARSAAVLRYLIEAKLDRALMHVAGYADTRPIADNSQEEGRSRNRRVEFVFEYETALERTDQEPSERPERMP